MDIEGNFWWLVSDLYFLLFRMIKVWLKLGFCFFQGDFEGFYIRCDGLVFGELGGVMCFVQVDFFMFDFMGVMGYEVSFVQFGFQGFVVFDQCVGDVQVDCIGLVGGVVVSGGDYDVE